MLYDLSPEQVEALQELVSWAADESHASAGLDGTDNDDAWIDEKIGEGEFARCMSAAQALRVPHVPKFSDLLSDEQRDWAQQMIDHYADEQRPEPRVISLDEYLLDVFLVYGEQFQYLVEEVAAGEEPRPESLEEWVSRWLDRGIGNDIDNHRVGSDWCEACDL